MEIPGIWMNSDLYHQMAEWHWEAFLNSKQFYPTICAANTLNRIDQPTIKSISCWYPFLIHSTCIRTLVFCWQRRKVVLPFHSNKVNPAASHWKQGGIPQYSFQVWCSWCIYSTWLEEEKWGISEPPDNLLPSFLFDVLANVTSQ